MKKTLAFLLLIPASVFAAPISISTGSAAPWQVNGNPAVIESPIPTPIWINNFGDGSWMGTTATDGAISLPTDGALPGTYTFTLNIGAYFGQAGLLSLQYAADNNVQWTISNGTLSGATVCATGDCFGSASGAPRSLTGSFAANSVLTATVTNLGTDRTAMGLLAVGTADTAPAPVPEPSTLVLAGLGMAGLLVISLRRR